MLCCLDVLRTTDLVDLTDIVWAYGALTLLLEIVTLTSEGYDYTGARCRFAPVYGRVYG